MKPTDPTTYTLVLRAKPGSYPVGPVQRLRYLLKVLGRQFGFQCLVATPMPPDEADPPGHDCQCDLCRDARQEDGR